MGHKASIPKIVHKKRKGLPLKVLEAYTRDVGRKIVRIDYQTMDKLNSKTGDVISITGKRITAARCSALLSSDTDKQIIRMDKLMRENCQTPVNEIVSLKKINSSFATSIDVNPSEPIPPIDERYLADALDNQVLMLDDKVLVPYFGGRLEFSIYQTSPENIPVIVNQHTKFTIGEVIKTPEEKKKIKIIKKIEEQIQEQEKMLEKLISLPTIQEAKINKILKTISTLEQTKKHFSK